MRQVQGNITINTVPGTKEFCQQFAAVTASGYGMATKFAEWLMDNDEALNNLDLSSAYQAGVNAAQREYARHGLLPASPSIKTMERKNMLTDALLSSYATACNSAGQAVKRAVKASQPVLSDKSDNAPAATDNAPAATDNTPATGKKRSLPKTASKQTVASELAATLARLAQLASEVGNKEILSLCDTAKVQLAKLVS